MEIDFDLLNLTYSDYGNFTYNEDTSNTPELTVAHNTVKIISLVIYSLTFLIGVPGNACVIWIAGLKMKRTVNGVWFINLAIADFLCCLSIPFSITNTLLDTNWPYGNVICQIIPLFVVLNMFARVFTLALISLDRLALVVRPVWAQNHRSLVLAWVPLWTGLGSGSPAQLTCHDSHLCHPRWWQSLSVTPSPHADDSLSVWISRPSPPHHHFLHNHHPQGVEQ
ncbi:hypothetical protein AALO_G00108870 [Alosa alosa]|uniref:C5a anaphylatoxin chemotactic receptor 1 n=1 Tax=Alosa alosa TaxID=278164 RepID=A0AAV6GTJ5_9TELE|nr:hypothetical protein AALO_G00108870 [Alosa alosa]